MFYIGIDIAKKNHEASIIDSNGKLLDKSISFSNSQAGCTKLISYFEKFEADTSNTIIGMEATGHYWVSLYSYLIDLGFTVYVINPIQSDNCCYQGCSSLCIKQLNKANRFVKWRLCKF